MLVTAETERWWGSPDTYAMREWNAELRPGGTWRVLVCFAEAGGSRHRARFWSTSRQAHRADPALRVGPPDARSAGHLVTYAMAPGGRGRGSPSSTRASVGWRRGGRARRRLGARAGLAPAVRSTHLTRKEGMAMSEFLYLYRLPAGFAAHARFCEGHARTAAAVDRVVRGAARRGDTSGSWDIPWRSPAQW